MLELFRSRRRAVVWFIEGTLLAALVVGTAGILGDWNHGKTFELLVQAFVISLVAQASLYYHGLYGRELDPSPTVLFVMTLRALTVAAAVLWLLFWIASDANDTARTSIAALATAAFLLPAWRRAYRHISSSKTFRRSAIVLGSGPLAHECAALLKEDNDLGVRLAGVLVSDHEPLTGDPDVIGHYSDLHELANQQDIALVVVAYSDRRGTFPAKELLELKFRGIEIEEGADLYEQMTGKLHVRELRPSQLIFAQGFRPSRAARWVKRALDLTLAAIGFIIALPLMALAALAIKLESPGSLLYSQVRTGVHGKPFTIRKFRSMRSDAELHGARFAEDNDPRITRVGRFIRATRIDELPQLWNVLIGDMSLVGPRPERPIFAEQLEREIPFFRQRLCVKPGVTGHAQVRYRYGASMEDHLEKLQYDLFYIKSFSIWFDLSILFDTVKVVLLRIGAR
jgi:sugar transferase (PEP-CTERM system associated)